MKLTFKQIMGAVVFAALSSAVINATIFFIFKAMGIFDATIIDPKSNASLTIAPVLMASIMPSLVAGLVFFLFEKYSKNGFKIFSIISIILVLASLFSPFSIPNVSMGFAIGLNLMHLAVAGNVLFFINRAKKAQLI
jgi:mannose/fructose/N-acetylgalactosamine-specific phosphotransferase system component IID